MAVREEVPRDRVESAQVYQAGAAWVTVGEHGGDPCTAEASLCLVHDESARRSRMVTSRGQKGQARVKQTDGSRIFVWF